MRCMGIVSICHRIAWGAPKPTLIYFRNSSVVAAYCALRLFFNSSPALCRTCIQLSQMCITLCHQQSSRQAGPSHQSNDAGKCISFPSPSPARSPWQKASTTDIFSESPHLYGQAVSLSKNECQVVVEVRVALALVKLLQYLQRNPCDESQRSHECAWQSRQG